MLKKSSLWSVVASVLLAAAPVVGTAPAHAEDHAFYTPPPTLPAANGAVIRTQATTFHLGPLRAIKVPAKVQRIMYRTTDRLNRPIAVTGTLLIPNAAWRGSGPRPLVAMPPGTQGIGDACAPSRKLATGTEYEGVFMSGLIARGYGVVMTDYQGLGTPGEHTYLVREALGRATLDSIRAAHQVPGTGLVANGPVAIYGYSQGGAAAASAAELAPTYAPEIKLAGVVAGAVPANIANLSNTIDNSLYFGFLMYALAGYGAAYDVDIDAVLNPTGRKVLAQARTACTVPAVLTLPFHRFSDLTLHGETLSQLLGAEPWRSIVEEQVIGRRKPTVPVMVTHSVLDDVVPYQVGVDLVKNWCALGAQVRFAVDVAPAHVGGAFASFADGFRFLEARFAGRPVATTC